MWQAEQARPVWRAKDGIARALPIMSKVAGKAMIKATANNLNFFITAPRSPDRTWT